MAARLAVHSTALPGKIAKGLRRVLVAVAGLRMARAQRLATAALAEHRAEEVVAVGLA